MAPHVCGGILDGKALTTGIFTADLSGGSEATITVLTRIASAQLSGGSQLTYSGSPSLGTVDTSVRACRMAVRW